MIEKVVGKLLELSEDEQARMIYEAQIKHERDDMARMRGALEKGRNEKALEIARKLLQRNLSIEEIIEDTGLSREEVEILRS